MKSSGLVPAWRPGQSGNPVGRPKGFAGLARDIRKRTNDGRELVDFALETFRNDKLKLSERWAAHGWLSDRGFGKPLTMIDLQGELGPAAPMLGGIDPSKLDPAHLAQLEAILTTLTAEPKVIEADSVPPEKDPDSVGS